MIITDKDKPLTADEALKISDANNDACMARTDFRDIMTLINDRCTLGFTCVQWDSWHKIEPETEKELLRLGYEIEYKGKIGSFSNDHNYYIIFGKCTCGAIKTNQPGHSQYCDRIRFK